MPWLAHLLTGTSTIPSLLRGAHLHTVTLCPPRQVHSPTQFTLLGCHTLRPFAEGILINFILCECSACVYVSVPCVCLVTAETRMRLLDPLELEL